jgi:hypothetical protein
MLLVLEMDRLLPTVDRPFKIEYSARVAERVRIPTTVELRTVLCTLYHRASSLARLASPTREARDAYSSFTHRETRFSGTNLA